MKVAADVGVPLKSIPRWNRSSAQEREPALRESFGFEVPMKLVPDIFLPLLATTTIAPKRYYYWWRSQVKSSSRPYHSRSAFTVLRLC